MTPPKRKLWWRLAGVIVVVVIVALMVRQLIRSWPAVGAYPWRWNLPLVVASLVLTQAGYLLLTRSWRSILRGIRVRLRLTTAYWIFILSNLGRYLPGKFWQIGAAALLGQRLGLSARDVAPSMIVYQLYLIPVGAALALSWGRLPAPYDGIGFQVLAWALVGAAGLAALWPHRVLHLLGPLARMLQIDPDRWQIETSRRIGIALQCAAGWLCLAVGFGLFAMAITPLGTAHLPQLARAFVASYLIGYLTLIAPGGLGVREGALAILLAPLLGSGPATALALLSRLWVTVTEAIAVMPALWWARRDRGQSPRPS